LILVYKKYYYSDTYYSNSAYEYFIENISGIIIKKTSYVTFDDIKAMEAKKYPLTHVWSLKFDVSGDAQVSYGTGAKQFQIVNNIVKIDFVWDVFEKVNIFDAILNNHKALNTQLEVEKKQDLGNSLIGIVLISILVMSVFWILFLADSEIFPFSFLLSTAIFFGGVIALNIWLIKSVRYILEWSRLVKYWGIIYTSKRSILYTKVDFIEKNQGMVNKIFGNGIIAIFTKGSSGKDMIFKDVSLHNELYETLLEKIQKGENQ